MKTFTQRFFKVLTEQDEELPMSDADAAANELDAGTDPGMLDVEPGPEGMETGGAGVAGGTNPADELKKQQNAQFAGQIEGWVVKIEEFIDYLNGLGEDSLNSQINSAPCDTIFDDISRSETKKIGRIAQDLRSLSESLKSYLISND